MAFDAVFTTSFEKDIRSIKRDKILFERLLNKVDEILQNPEHYKPLKNVLKGKRRAHIGSFVILFEVETDKVIFYRFEHHDKVYD
ncbi:MAG: type II toxin-antitoxin system RelE/ParE family toxin [Nanoarchaeota archaeon]